VKLYSIRDWDKHFEKAQTRKVGRVQWVPLPVKHDGLTFGRVMATSNGLAIYGAWVLIVQVAAKCDPRGTLADEKGPLTAEDIALKTGAPEALLQEALDVLSSDRIGWLMVSGDQSDDSPSQRPTNSLPTEKNRAEPEPPQQIQTVGIVMDSNPKLVELQDRTGHDRTTHNTTTQDTSAAAAGVCVGDENFSEIGKDELLAYATDPVAGKGIYNPHGWATARLKDHSADGDVRRWLEERGKPSIDQCPDCKDTSGFIYPNGIGVGPVVKCKHPNLLNGEQRKESA
jgi:hypothetical protein